MKFMVCILLLAVMNFGFCHENAGDTPTTIDAIIVDGYAINNRSARAPTGLYSTQAGRQQLAAYIKRTGDEMPTYEVSGEVIAKLWAIAQSPDNVVEKGRGNFFLRTFSAHRDEGSRSITKPKLKEIIDAIPVSSRGNLPRMYEHG